MPIMASKIGTKNMSTEKSGGLIFFATLSAAKAVTIQPLIGALQALAHGPKNPKRMSAVLITRQTRTRARLGGGVLLGDIGYRKLQLNYIWRLSLALLSSLIVHRVITITNHLTRCHFEERGLRREISCDFSQKNATQKLPPARGGSVVCGAIHRPSLDYKSSESSGQVSVASHSAWRYGVLEMTINA